MPHLEELIRSLDGGEARVNNVTALSVAGESAIAWSRVSEKRRESGPEKSGPCGKQKVEWVGEWKICLVVGAC